MLFKSQLLGSITLVLVLHCFIAVRAEDEIKHDVFIDKIDKKIGDDIVSVDLNMEKTGPLKFMVNGVIESLKDLGKDHYFAINVSVSDTADGEYEFMSKYPNGHTTLCEFLEGDYNENVYELMKEHSDVPLYEKCELSPAKFTIKDMPLDGTELDEYMPKGYYIVSMYIMDATGNVIVQYDFYTHVEEK